MPFLKNPISRSKSLAARIVGGCPAGAATFMYWLAAALRPARGDLALKRDRMDTVRDRQARQSADRR